MDDNELFPNVPRESPEPYRSLDTATVLRQREKLREIMQRALEDELMDENIPD